MIIIFQVGQEDHVQGGLPRRLQQCVERSDDYSRGLPFTQNHILLNLTFPPQARQIKHCMTEHTECVSYEILRREAQQTIDPNDPMVNMYERKQAAEKMDRNAGKEVDLKKRKKERLIVNPEFVEGMDTGDGSVQYDEDYDKQNEV